MKRTPNDYLLIMLRTIRAVQSQPAHEPACFAVKKTEAAIFNKLWNEAIQPLDLEVEMDRFPDHAGNGEDSVFIVRRTPIGRPEQS